MLVLTRKKGQSLNISHNIRIILLETTGDTVRIGIEAPPEVAVYRSEIYQTLQKENRESMASKDILSEIRVLARPDRDKTAK